MTQSLPGSVNVNSGEAACGVFARMRSARICWPTLMFLSHDDARDGTGDVVHVVEVAARRAKKLEVGRGTLFFREATVKVCLSTFHVLDRRGTMLLEHLDPCQGLVELREITERLAVIGLGLTEIGRMHQREIVALSNGLAHLHDDLFHLPGHG